MWEIYHIFLEQLSCHGGCLSGVPAIAVSQEIRGVDTSSSAQFITRLVRQYMTDPLQEGTILSVNILLETIRVSLFVRWETLILARVAMNWLAKVIMNKSMSGKSHCR